MASTSRPIIGPRIESMIKELTKQDIFLAPTDAIIHQANCQCTMGSGIAKIIKEKFPEAYAADCRTKKGDRSKMGRSSFARVVSPENPTLKVIFNMYSQFDYGLDIRHTSYDAMADGLTGIKKAIKLESLSDITVLAVPYRIGSDRGGGDWKIVKSIIESVFLDDAKILCLICDNTGLGTAPANKVSK